MIRFAAVALLLIVGTLATAAPLTHHQSRDAIDALFLAANFSGVVRAWRGSPDSKGLLAARQYGDMFNMGGGHSVPMSPHARFPVASNTKLMVAIALYQLHERGLVDLNASIASYLNATDFANFGLGGVMDRYCPTLVNSTECQNITFVQLLEMSAGIANIGDQFLPYPGSLGFVVGRYIRNHLLFVPGTSFYYSNPSFMIAAYFIEKFSGMSVEQYWRKNVFEPLGMHDTYFDPYNGKFAEDPNRVGEYYEYFELQTSGGGGGKLLGRGICSSEFDLGSANGAGGVISTPDDEARLYFKMFNFTDMSKSPGAGGAVLSAASVLEIVYPRNVVPGANLFYAQGLFVVAGAGQAIPTQIVYEGEIMCSHTANVFALNHHPPVMTQAFRNVDAYYVTKADYDAAKVAQRGNFWGVVAGWTKPMSPMELAQQLRKLVLT